MFDNWDNSFVNCCDVLVRLDQFDMVVYLVIGVDIIWEEVLEWEKVCYGGMKFGFVFFGWFIVIGMVVIFIVVFVVIGIVVGLGSEVNFNEVVEVVLENVSIVGVVGVIVLVVILFVVYFCGGYVVGWMV